MKVKKLLMLLLTGSLLLALLPCCAAVPAKPNSDTGAPSAPSSDAVSTEGSASSSDASAGTETDSSASTDTDTDGGTTSTQPVYETPQEVLEASPHLIGLTDQKNGRLIVRDLAAEDWSDDSSVVWQYRDERTRAAAGLKFRYSELFGGEVVLFCGPAGAGILSYETKEMLFFTAKAGINPHGVELLPDGTFIVGSTTDNLVSVFDAASGKVSPVQTLNYENVHGILWDPEYDLLWMAGRTKLSAFSVTKNDGKAYVSQIYGMSFETGDWLHDLVPCYGDPQGLFVTCGTGIYYFDKEKEEFTSSYPCSVYAAGIKTSPAMGCYPDRVMPILYTVPGKTVYKDWCMNEISVLVPLSETRVRKITRVAPNDAYYKIRAWISDYQ